MLGVASGDAETRLRDVYSTPLEAGTPLLVMELETAELVKVAANAFLATKISFINAALAEVVSRRVIIDARCCLDAALWRGAGWTVHVLGRPQAADSHDHEDF